MSESGASAGARWIALYNHKGGVCKTTVCFNMAWEFAAHQQYRVLMVDTDPQQNLTQIALRGAARHIASEKLRVFSETSAKVDNDEGADKPPAMVLNDSDDGNYRTIFRDALTTENLVFALSPVIEEAPVPVHRVSPVRIPHDSRGIGELYLLPGRHDITEYEEKIALAFGSGAMLCPNAPGAVAIVLDDIVRRFAIDIVLLDLSPSIGALNRNLVMMSHALVVPCTPDLFSCEAIKSLTQYLPKWKAEKEQFMRRANQRDIHYRVPNRFPKFHGCIMTLRGCVEREEDEDDHDDDDDEQDQHGRAVGDTRFIQLCDELFQKLEPIEMAFSADEYQMHDIDHIIGEIPELGRVCARSHVLGRPVSSLSMIDTGMPFWSGVYDCTSYLATVRNICNTVMYLQRVQTGFNMQNDRAEDVQLLKRKAETLQDSSLPEAKKINLV